MGAESYQKTPKNQCFETLKLRDSVWELKKHKNAESYSKKQSGTNKTLRGYQKYKKKRCFETLRLLDAVWELRKHKNAEMSQKNKYGLNKMLRGSKKPKRPIF